MKSNNNILRVLELLGLILPTDKESVVEFEKRHKSEMDKIEPKFWNDPTEIIRRGRIDHSTANNNSDYLCSQGLAQVAREGGTISSAMKKKMLEDRKNAKN